MKTGAAGAPWGASDQGTGRHSRPAGPHSGVAAPLRKRPAVCAFHVRRGETSTTALLFMQRAITALGPRRPVWQVREA